MLKLQPNSGGGANRQTQSSKASKFQPREKVLSQYSDRMDLATRVSDSATSALYSHSKKMDADRYRARDKADRATSDLVLDPRTKMMIFRMLSKGIIHEITGSISTGKEANVFRAEKNTPEGTEYYALKVYKTSILTFKNREKYIDGDFRLRRGYHGTNPRKMVKTWGEKEVRNLTRIHQAGIPCPKPVLLKSHLFLMTFIGSSDGTAAPLLKNVNLSDSKAREMYLELVQTMRRLYQDCHLIHADLSEFNILYHEGKAYIIDVSQAVEHDHPNALVFLRKDCTNVTEYFRKCGVATMTVRELFDFITDMTITPDNMDQYLDAAMDIASTRSFAGISEEDKVDEEVFKSVFIPRTLGDVPDFEGDMLKKMRGEELESHYHTVTGLKSDLTGAQEVPALLEDKIQMTDTALENDNGIAESDDDEDHSDEDDDDGSGSARDDGDKKGTVMRPKNETAEERRERKKAVKDARKEKLKTKVPKHVKKRGEKVAKLKKSK